MAHSISHLGQIRPGAATATSIYSPGAGQTTIVTSVVICNTSGASAKVRLYLDNDGTTYDQSTALMWDAAVAADTTVVFEPKGGITMDNSSGNIAGESDVASALTFTASGQVFE